MILSRITFSGFPKLRRISSIALLSFMGLGVSSSLYAQPDNSLTAEEKAAGWQLLFDGHSLNGWRTYQQDEAKSQWQVIDGALVLTEGGGGDLISQEKYHDFDLKLDWKISEAGNSGLFFLASESTERVYYNSPEVQLLDNERHPDNKIDDHRSGSLYDLIASPPSSHRLAGEWNHLRIQLLNRQLSIWQNDVQTVQIEIGSERWNTLVRNSKFIQWPGFGENESGHIGVQDHGDRVDIKNIKIREL